MAFDGSTFGYGDNGVLIGRTNAARARACEPTTWSRCHYAKRRSPRFFMLSYPEQQRNPMPGSETLRG